MTLGCEFHIFSAVENNFNRLAYFRRSDCHLARENRGIVFLSSKTAACYILNNLYIAGIVSECLGYCAMP